jgi:GxxExxY protein
MQEFLTTETQSHRKTEKERDPLTGTIIAAAIEVHRSRGPGLLESAYEECLCHELHLRALAFQRQVDLPVRYKGLQLDCGYKLDLVVEQKGSVGVEISREDCPSSRGTAS